jgi:hypothetical protein
MVVAPPPSPPASDEIAVVVAPTPPPPAAPPVSDEVVIDVAVLLESVAVDWTVEVTPPSELVAVAVLVAIVPVTDAVTVDATVVTEIEPTPVCKFAHSARSLQKAPPQTKDCVPQQLSGTVKVSPVERVLTPGFASARQVALRKSSAAT